jgi:hypothetical protein
MTGSFFMSLWRFPGQFMSMQTFFSPYMFLLATLPLCSTTAVFFGSSRFLRGAFGSTCFVIGYLTLMAVPVVIDSPSPILRSFDISAMSSLIEIISRTAYEQTGERIESVLFLASYAPETNFNPTLRLVFNGLNYTTTDYEVFGVMLLLTAALTAFSAPLYGITKSIAEHSFINKKSKNLSEADYEQGQKPTYSIATPSNNTLWNRGVSAEIKLMLKGYPFIWKLIVLTGFMLCFFLNINTVRVYIMPLLFLWFINVFSCLGNREYQNDMVDIIAVIPGGKFKQIIFSWAAGIIIAIDLTLPVFIRLFFAKDIIATFAVISGAVFLPSLALFIGEYTKTNRVFEVLFIIITYAIINNVPALMYMGSPDIPSIYRSVLYLVVGLGFGVVAVFKRQIT